MSKQKKLAKEVDRRDKQIRMLYTIVWFLACPLAYVIALLLKFTQINVVYWTLLVIPVLLGAYNVSQVPRTRPKGAEEPAEPEELAEPEDEDEMYVTRVQRAKLLAAALRAPVLLALPLLATLVVHLLAA